MSNDDVEDLKSRLCGIIVSSQGQKEMLKALAKIVVPSIYFDEDQAAWEIQTLCLEDFGEHGYEFERNLMGNLWDLWNMLLEVVQLVPHHQVGHDRVLATLRALQRLNVQHPTHVQIQDTMHTLWNDLPLLATCLTVTPTTPTQMGPLMSNEHADKWMNINSFSAKLWGEGFVDERWLDLPVARLREALEEPGHTTWDMRIHLQVVKDWISYAGIRLYHTLSEELSAADLEMLLYCGDLFRAVPTSPLARWIFWKGRLVDARNGLPDDLSRFAMKIVRTMSAAEQYVDR